MRLPSFVGLAVAVLTSCSNGDNRTRNVVDLGFFSAPTNLELGDLVRVEGLVGSDKEGNFALFTRGGSGDYSTWDCVVLRDMSWTEKMFLPYSQSDDLQSRGFEATGRVAAAYVTFGRGDGQHGPRQCLIAIDVESVERLEISDGLARRLRMRTEDIVQLD